MFTVGENVTFILDNNITLMGHNGNTGPMVNVYRGTFRMNAGSTITGNTNARRGNSTYGGGVYVSSTLLGSSIFEMAGGTISGNTADLGGGVSSAGTFTMSGGTISGNTARAYGGGVNAYDGTFTKNGGTITGYTSDQANGNVVRDEDGYALGRRGHAVWFGENQRKETTAGPGDNLFYSNLTRRATGAWD